MKIIKKNLAKSNCKDWLGLDMCCPRMGHKHTVGLAERPSERLSGSDRWWIKGRTSARSRTK